MPIQPCHEQYWDYLLWSEEIKETLWGITDKIWKLLSSRKSICFLIYGKEILLKAQISLIRSRIQSISNMESLFWGKEPLLKGLRWRSWLWSSINQATMHGRLGIYNVKSGYQLAVSYAEQDDTASSHSMENWWSTFWKMKLPPKVRIFVWKVFHSTLPSESRTLSRHIATSPTAKICNSAEESINHALFDCPRAKAVWELSSLHIDFHTLRQSASADILLHLSTTLSTSEFELFLVLCWCNWHERNAIYHANTNFNCRIDPRPSSSSHMPQNGLRLLKAAQIKHDAAIDKACNKVGIGATLRNSDGFIVAAISKPLLGNYKAEEMEAIGLALSLNWLISNNLSVDFIETDSLLVVQGLLSSQSYLSAFHAILNNINFLVSFFPRAQINHVYRSANTYAHTLAKYALTVDTECIWVETFPSPLVTLM
uniref:RNase H type-1 domain-containing protein n=1 Tax=Cannabis sativa TaxID=3483 RepID=A0A803QKK6_CANSA